MLVYPMAATKKVGKPSSSSNKGAVSIITSPSDSVLDTLGEQLGSGTGVPTTTSSLNDMEDLENLRCQVHDY